MDIQELERDYRSNELLYNQLLNELVNQFRYLLSEKQIDLGFNIEARVKSFSSIRDKVVRNGLSLDNIEDLNDLIGIRIICLLKKDMVEVKKLITDNFTVLNEENTEERLDENQFGYTSIHFELKIKDEWLNLPTFRKYRKIRFETQLRTASQHIWAAVSHKFQYKKETDVPKPLLRSVNRLSALLEICDNEFERIFGERDTFVKLKKEENNEDEAKLDIEILKNILKKYLPPENEDANEDYSELLTDLNHYQIITNVNLTKLIADFYEITIAEDKKFVQEILAIDPEHKGYSGNYFAKRFASGVFYTHSGLIRKMLRLKFGDNIVANYLRSKNK